MPLGGERTEEAITSMIEKGIEVARSNLPQKPEERDSDRRNKNCG
jgi:hypothetical protein